MRAWERGYQVGLNERGLGNEKTMDDVQRWLAQPASRRTEYNFPRWTQKAPLRWLRLLVYYALVWPATQILAHPRIVGRDHLRDVRGPLLIICNHVTRRADVGLVLAALPPRYRNRLATAIIGGTLTQNSRLPCSGLFVPH